MKKEALEKAKELEAQISVYKNIAYAVSFPWQKFKLWKKHTYIGAAGYSNDNTEVNLDDKELAKLIEDYCREKIKKLNKELEEL